MNDDRTAFEPRLVEGDRLCSPSAARNAGPIGEAWGDLLPTEGAVLEVASGTGEHAAVLTRRFPSLRWQPSDPDAGARRSAAAWAVSDRGASPADAIAAPLALDATASSWWLAAGGPYDVLYCANMIHIAPLAACEGLLRGAGAVLTGAGRVALYGPFSRRGVMADSNARFSENLRARDPAWGVRDLDDQVQPLAARFGLTLAAVRPMPANNLFVVFERN